MQEEVYIDIPDGHSPVQDAIIHADGSSLNFCGRQYGKTEAGVGRLVKYGIERPDLYWWVGYNWRAASMKEAWSRLVIITEKMWRAFEMDPQPHIRISDHELEWPNGNKIWFRTAERPESLAGSPVAGVIGDECSLWSKRVWEEFLEATLLIKRGWACFIGIPKGYDNWASKLWRDIVAGLMPGWTARKAKTVENPLADENELQNKRRRMPDWLYRQEYEGDIIMGVDVPFPSPQVDACVSKGVYERVHDDEKRYVCYTDASGGGADEFTLNIWHKERKGKEEHVYQDLLLYANPMDPFRLVQIWGPRIKPYRIRTVYGDPYAGEWPREAFRSVGINYVVSEYTASDCYVEFQPLVKQGIVHMLDDGVQRDQICALLERKAITGRRLIIHPTGDHDDRANVAAGGAVMAHQLGSRGYLHSETQQRGRTRETSSQRGTVRGPSRQSPTKQVGKRLIARYNNSIGRAGRR